MHTRMQADPVDPARRNAAALSAALAACLALVLTATGCATGKGNAMAAASETRVKEKVIFQVSEADPKSWNLALNNMKNVQTSLGKGNVEVELVVYGPGIGMLKAESTAGNRVNDAVAAGVKVVACENTMKAQKLSRDGMLASVGYVPGGGVELMTKQKQGYAYIRP
jgi:hypothetical protein